jgi:hypothetical protein
VLEGYLPIFTSRRQDDWDDFLPTGEFQYNNTVHSSTQQTPFMIDTGRHPRMGFEPQQLSGDTSGSADASEYPRERLE